MDLFFLPAVLAFWGAGESLGQTLVKPSKGGAYWALDFSPEGAYLLAASARKGSSFPSDGGVHLYDLKTQEKRVLFRIHDNAKCGAVPVAVAFSGDGKSIFAGGDCMLAAWSPKGDNWFLHIGCNGLTDSFRAESFVSPKRGSSVAFTQMRRLETDDGRQLSECRVMVWNPFSAKQSVATTKKDKLQGLMPYKLAFSDTGKLLAHWHPQTKELVVLDLLNGLPMRISAVDAKIPAGLHMRFSSDEKSIWVLSGKNLHQFDVRGTKKMRSFGLGFSSQWFHPLPNDSRFMILQEPENDKQTSVLVFIDSMERKLDKRVDLRRVVGPVAISPDATVFAGSDPIHGGIYVWSVADLLRGAK